MNWGFIGWVVGILLTIYLLKFVILALRSLFSKESMESLMGTAERKIKDANEWMTATIKKKAAAKKKAEKMARKIKDDRPMVIRGTIR